MNLYVPAAEVAWRQYRDHDMRNSPRRRLRKREFFAGWEARRAFEERLREVSWAEGPNIPQVVHDEIARGRIIQAIKELRDANPAMELGRAKRIIDHLQGKNTEWSHCGVPG